MTTQPVSRARTDPDPLDADTHPIPVLDDASLARPPWIEEAVATLALLCGLLTAVAVFVPADGRLSVGLHDLVGQLLGRASFLAPFGLLAVGVLLLMHRFVPDVELPRGRLFGVGLLVVVALPTAQLLLPLTAGTGELGQWLASTLLEWLGAPATTLLLVVLGLLGALLALDRSLGDLVVRARQARLPVVLPSANADDSEALALPEQSAPRRP